MEKNRYRGHRRLTEAEIKALKKKRTINVVVSFIVFTIILCVALVVYPSPVTVAFSVVLIGMFFCMAASYQRMVTQSLLLCLGCLVIVGCLYLIISY